MPTICIIRRKAKILRFTYRPVKAIVMPPAPPRPAFMQPAVPSKLSADTVAKMFGLVRKIDRRTGKMHFERRQIKALRSGIRTNRSAADMMRADAEANAKARVEALKKWASE
jgi:hypothetical protein